MFGSDSRARRSRARGSRSPLAALLLCLAMLLPGLPVQPAVAGPDSAPATSLRAQQPDQPLIAFLRQGNLWLMNEDGSDRRQITISKGGVQRFAWSPSGQYIAILHESRLDLYDVATGEMRDLIDVPGEFPGGRSSYGNVFSWAVDADELMVIFDDGGTGTFTRVALDGAANDVTTYNRPFACGGMDGPIPIVELLMAFHEDGSAFVRGAYEGLIWWTDRDVAYVNTPCFPNISIDLTSGQVIEYPETAWLAAGPNGSILIQDPITTRARSAGVFDPATGTVQPLPIGDEGPLVSRTGLAWTAAGEVVFARVTARGDSAFTSRFDDYPIQYTDHTVDIMVTGVGAEPQLVASLDVYGTGVPSVAGDGAIIVGAVDNPTALMGVDESRYSEYSPEIYAEHQKILRIDPSGEVTVLLTNAYRPRLQPAGTPGTEAPPPAEAEPTDLTGTPEATVEPTEVAEQPAASGDGWIAYSSGDNIWLSRPDGSDQRQVTTDGSPERPYGAPSWSHDGTMLVFSTRNAEAESGNDIYVLRDGAVTRVPVIHNCDNAAFTPDNARLVLLCSTSPGSSTIPDQRMLDSYPPYGFVSVVDLDGSNWEVLAPVQLQIDGSDTLWWTMLSTHDISVSPVDGEMLVNSIFWSSARWRQIHVINSEGEWDARFEAPPGDQGRTWGQFSADGTNILARLCRGCYKDSPGPPNTSILLLDREGNLLETLYTPDPNVTIGSFTQSPDGTRLLLRTTTEETDFDLGTAGLTYVTQMVDIATGTVTEVPIDGGAFAWQPVAVDIAVPESTAGLQPTTRFIRTAPVVAIACTTTSEGFSLSTDGPILPEGCSVAEGMRFTVSGASGEAYGQCVIGSAAFCSQPEIWMPVDVEVTVTVDESTIPDGYAVVGGNPQQFTFGSEYLNTDAAQWLIVVMPADVAAAQGEAPDSTEETAEATEAATESGSASGLTIEPGQDWIAYVGDDGNIWLMQPDGSQQGQVTTDGTPDFPYRQPSWSHDGTMLVFSRQATYMTTEPSYLYLFRNGMVSRVPRVYGCNAAAFLPGDEQLVLGCASDSADTEVPAATLQTDPSMGFVSLANLDGSDWRILMPYPTDPPGWPNVGRAWVYDISVAADGAILLNWGGPGGDSMALMGSGSSSATRLDSPLETGAVTGKFLPGNDEILINACKGCYKHTREDAQHTVAWMDRSGAITTTLLVPDPVTRVGMPTISPDGATLIYTVEGQGFPFYGTIQSHDLATGDEVTIASGMEPAWQPSGEASAQQPSPTDSGTSTVEATWEPVEVATETAETGSGLRIEPESNWIAYEGDDSNIWLMQPDGSQQVQVTTDGTREAPYAWPTWSHDGTMLVFARRPPYDLGESATIHVLRDGAVSQVPNVHGCNAAAFMPGDQQLVLGCGSDFPAAGASDSAMQTDPALGFVSMVNLDGSDWHVHVPYHRASEGVWPNHEGGPDMAWVESMSVHPDGTILLSFSGFHGHGLALLEPGSTTPVVHRSPLGRGGVVGRFFPGSDEILIGACKGCYPRANSGDPEFTIGWMDRDGAITTTLYVPDPLQEMGMPTISPDGGTLVFSTNRAIQSLDLATGSQVTIGAGTAVAWQPNASVAMDRPEEPVMAASASSTDPEPALATEVASGTVPSGFMATWSGRGVQENPYGEWPVTISITGGGVGEVVGTSEYPEEGCGGNLVLQEVTADAIVLLEQLTYGQEACADNGTITLSGIDNVAVQFAWSGIGPYGTPSTASGTLYRPDSATDSTSQPGTQDGPTVDTTQLHSFFIRTWEGTGYQLNPTNQWPITVTFTGGRPGEVVGSAEYPTLGCGGELILESIDPHDNFLTIYVTERITYGHENCTDVGSFTFSGAEGGTRLLFSYQGQNVTTTAEGTLDPVAPDAVSAPSGGDSAAQSGTQDGPVIDTTQLHRYYIGTFSGTGNQTNPDNAWPITVTFTGGQPGDVIGSVEYPSLGCGGELTLVSINPNDEWLGFKASERITYGHDNCIDGGTFSFSSAESGIGITFGWTSPVSATRASGHLPEVEPGTASAPAGEETAASRSAIEAFIGTWEGTGTQSNRSNSWPITFTITGGREGEVVGSVDYPTLGCGGELTLVRTLPWSHIAPGIELTERITYGAGNCIDGGTFELRLAEGGGVPSFNWVSPDGSITARGPIEWIQPGVGALDTGSTTEPAGGNAAGGGPPSIYDDAEAEPVPIEAEGG